jgi:hypothetical protein
VSWFPGIYLILRNHAYVRVGKNHALNKAPFKRQTLHIISHFDILSDVCSLVSGLTVHLHTI